MKQLNGVKVLIGPSTFGEQEQSALNRLREAGCEVIGNPYKRRLNKEELLILLSDDVIGLIAGLEPLDRDVLEKTRLKVISRCGSGISNVDLEAAKELGIKVCSTPDAPTDAVAELALAAMLSLLRAIPQMDRHLHDGKWIKKTGTQLKGKTVVIIGFGRIGRRVASLLKSFGVRLIIVDPNLQGDATGVEVSALNKALPAADIVTIHASGEEQIIGEKEFNLLKPGAFLLNSSRGSLVNEAALIKALEAGRIKGAWLDTFKLEPYNGPLTEYDQVILTPHAGSYTSECRVSMEMEAANNLISALKSINEGI